MQQTMFGVKMEKKTMQVNQIEIDNNLIDNAIKFSGLRDKKELIEKALVLFTQFSQIKQPTLVDNKWEDFFISNSVFDDDFLLERDNKKPQDREFY